MNIFKSIMKIFKSSESSTVDYIPLSHHQTISPEELDARKRFKELGFSGSGNYLQTLYIDGHKLSVNMMREDNYHIYINDNLITENGNMNQVESLIISLNKSNLVESRNKVIDKILNG